MYGVVLHAHPIRGESHNQRNTTGEVTTIHFNNFGMPSVLLVASERTIPTYFELILNTATTTKPTQLKGVWSRAGVTNMVVAGARSPARTTSAAYGLVLTIA